MANEDALSQEDIDALIESMETDGPSSPVGPLSNAERELIGEYHKLMSDASATAFSVMLGQTFQSTAEPLQEFESLTEMDEPFGGEEKLLVAAQFSQGIDLMSILVLPVSQARMITSLIVTDGAGAEGEPLNDLEQEAFQEVMKQMLEAGSTSMGSLVNAPVACAPPLVSAYNAEQLAAVAPSLISDHLIRLDTAYQSDQGLAFHLCELLVSGEIRGQLAKVLGPPASGASPAAGAGRSQEAGEPFMESPQSEQAKAPYMASDPVTVQPVQFQSMDNQPNFYGEANRNLELVMDVTLCLTVELGKTEVSIKEVLEMSRGSVIELDRIAGEPVDLLANGKLIAKGEVVVIEDNFGLRITSIVSPADRLRGL